MANEQSQPAKAPHEVLLLLAREIATGQDTGLKISAPDGWTVEWHRADPTPTAEAQGPRPAQRGDPVVELKELQRERDRAQAAAIQPAIPPIERLLDSYRSRQTPRGTVPTTGDVTNLRIRDDVEGWRVRWRRADGETKSWGRREVTGLTLDEACARAAAQIEAAI
jgi:hypothetical protein